MKAFNQTQKSSKYISDTITNNNFSVSPFKYQKNCILSKKGCETDEVTRIKNKKTHRKDVLEEGEEVYYVNNVSPSLNIKSWIYDVRNKKQKIQVF